MAANLKQAEYLTDIITHRIEQLINERNILRRELARKSNGSLEQDKAFVQAYQSAVVSNAMAEMKSERLEHMLMIR